MTAGSDDLTRAVSALAARVPEPLAVLARLAYNYRWSWTPDGPQVFRDVSPDRWERCGENPVRLLQEASTEALQRAAADGALLERAAAVEAAVSADLARPPADLPATPDNPAAFFCAEYGVHRSLPIYSGGLGALAGDILKEASDRAVPLVAVGLLYRQGYFRQRIDASGWQHEYWVDTDPERVPAALVTGADGEPVTVTVPVRDLEVTAQIWRVDVGRIPLFLLDTDRPENDLSTRWITSRLYIGDPDTRLAQYILLGVGGVRALQALDIEPSLLHLNEGHAAFVSVEMARVAGGAFAEGVQAARAKTIFTTHTPVPAGNDTYPVDEVCGALSGLLAQMGADAGDVVRLGRTRPDDPGEPFGVTQFALRTSRAANGVSRRHGEVARRMWQGLWPDREVDEVPIRHVTNGVHVPTWLGGPMRRLLDRHLGEEWLDRQADPATWAPVDDIPDEELWAVRQEQRAEFVDWVRGKSATDRLGRDDPRSYAESAAKAFDPGALTIGFARRLATYKRLYLLVREPERALRLLANGRPVQLVLAGKAHPRDDEGKRMVQHLFAHKWAAEAGARVVYLDDYDLSSAARLVRGCDVWLNLPRPPLEASGTSGMKSAVNGGLQLSVLDGWWAEGYDGTNGWALSGEEDADHGAQDHRDAVELQRVLAEEVAASFYDRDEAGIPRAWLARVKASLKTNGPAFSATRMIEDYTTGFYPAGAKAGVR
ncbi:MAG TPA: alpha-glucan family phosphorylase [Solirubrobacteraceae bacterium]|nr:alpha-glucan family phosphorylase [Solirubrobacteraceae bacterium]